MTCGDPTSHASRLLENVTVVANDRLTEGIGLITLRSPRVAAAVRPGQFVHLRIAKSTDAILRRPFSVHAAEGENIQLLYQVIGRGTRALAAVSREDQMDLIGPLGTGFSVPQDTAHAMIVAGGLGAAPMGLLLEHLAECGVATTVALGAATAGRLVTRERFSALARRVEIATDDGSAGEKGLVTSLASRLFDEDRPDVLYSCGPEAMSRIVGGMAVDAGVACQVSLERLMACGVGACLSCVVTTKSGLKRACVDGPVFNAEEVTWRATEAPPRH
jgi:dihydroorotate dehydrogenase electron transfer subunit